MSSTRRVANALIEISSYLGAPLLLPRATTHHVIATFASTIREVVSVEMSGLVAGGAVSKRERLLVLNRDKLGEIVSAEAAVVGPGRYCSKQ